MHNPTWDIEQLLRMRSQQLDQQSRAAGVQIRGPTDLTTGRDLRDRGDQLQQRGLVVLDPFREQHRPCLIDHDAMMGSFARVDSYPECRHILGPFDQLHFFVALSITTPARPYPTINVVILNQRSSHRRAAGGHSQ
jgi:hypothetical protein